MTELNLTIYRCDDDPPIRLAARELARCLRVMTGARVQVRRSARLTPERAGIYLGLPEHFQAVAATDVPAADRWDDAVFIRSHGESLVLTGSNARSVLFAAYAWLEALGARWPRPGKDGEYLPRIAMPALLGWNIVERATDRHRGICIEGSCFIEQVRELIAWMPKLRMNAYMLQFRASAYFWRRWYERSELSVIRNSHLLSLDECAALDAQVVEAVRERGLLFHRVGHGWTSEAVGNHASGWEKEESAPAEVRHLLAEVNGVRDWFDGIPLNTELCYSNLEARRRVVDEVIAYAVAHPEVDVLHFWASDGTNNCCECEQCAAMLPSDWYVTLLNEISARMAEAAPRMRLVALCYSNTMWPPVQVPPIGVGDNVIFMFAPIARCYAHTILDPDCREEPVLTPFARNKVIRPRANQDYMAMLRAWQRYLPADVDSFVFDYHLLWHLPNDLLAYDFAGMVKTDLREFRDAGLNGMLNCQLQRTTLPTGLPQTAMARHMWDGNLDQTACEDEYLHGAFGPAADIARSFLADFRHATGAHTHRGKWWQNLTAATIAGVRIVLRAYAPRLRTALSASTHPTWRRSLRLLAYYIRFQDKLWSALAAHAAGRADAIARLENTLAFLKRTEPQVYRWMDTTFWWNALHHGPLKEWKDAL